MSRYQTFTNEQLADATALKARLPPHAVYRKLAAETVMLNVQTGTYYGLNATAGRMLEVLERSANLHIALHTLVDDFEIPEEQLAPDLLMLCNDLGAKGLMEFVLLRDPTADPSPS